MKDTYTDEDFYRELSHTPEEQIQSLYAGRYAPFFVAKSLGVDVEAINALPYEKWRKHYIIEHNFTELVFDNARDGLTHPAFEGCDENTVMGRLYQAWLDYHPEEAKSLREKHQKLLP